MTKLNPQNPYVSYLVAASAGSGKTYQLSRRFLFLIGAGAEPSQALTVTFTKKAAGEMRARILQEAARLKVDTEAQAAFDAELAAFRTECRSPYPLPPPRPAAEVARLVLGSSQQLKISTIDSLFLDWVSKFPFEAQGETEFPAPFSLVDAHEGRSLDQRAFAATCQLLSRGLAAGDAGLVELLESIPDGAVLSVEDRLKALDRQETFLWYAEQVQPTGEALLAHPLGGYGGPETKGEVIDLLRDPLLAVAALLSDESRRGRCLDAIAASDLDGLVASNLLTAAWTVSGNMIKGKKREAAASEIAVIEALLGAFNDRRKLVRLNRLGATNYQLYRFYRALRDQLKLGSGLVEFRDLVKGAYRIFHGEHGAGVRFLLSHTVRHLLLDEFQDTSRLQWSIFQEVSSQMLAGQGVEAANGPPPTVFLVGDAKQSIYGFREADPAVIGDAKKALAERLKVAPLNDSYRTAQVVLDLVNATFGDGATLANFVEHRTAARVVGQPFVPDVGRVLVTPLLVDDEKEEDAADWREAQLVAATLQRALSGKLPTPVYDKATGGFRALRPADVALLYRSTTKAALFERALRQAGIACQREEERGFFARAEIADACALLKFLALPHDVPSFAQVIRSPLGQAPDADLIDLLSATRGRDLRGAALLSALKHKDEGLAATLSWLSARADRLLPHEILSQGLARLGAFDAYARPEFYAEADAELAQRNLVRLVEIVMGLEQRGTSTLISVTERLAEMAKEDDVGNASAETSAVTLMTIHKAKGLEFPWVALVDTGRPWGKLDSYWMQADAATSSPGIYFTGTRDGWPTRDPAFTQMTATAEASVADECQRLLYVGLTRSRQYLMISGHESQGHLGLGTTAPYQSLAAAMERGGAGRELVSLVIQGQTLNGWAAGLGVARAGATKVDRPVPQGDRGSIDRPLTDRKDLPRELKVKAPSRDHEVRAGALASRPKPRVVGRRELAQARGVLLHAGLEALAKGHYFDADATWRTLTRDESAEAQATLSSAVDELDRLSADPVRQALFAEAVRLDAELPIIHLDGSTLVHGTIDLMVERADGSLRLVDYKTTVFEGDASELAAVADEELRQFAEARGYHEQMRAYARAVKAMRPGVRVEAEVYFTSLGRRVDLGQLA